MEIGQGFQAVYLGSALLLFADAGGGIAQERQQQATSDQGTGQTDRAWARSAFALDSAWNEQTAVNRLGEPEVSMSSTIGSNLIWTFYFPRSGVAIEVSDRRNRVLDVSIRDTSQAR